MRKKNPESGYILLLVFAMAAIVAVTLYMQVPRVAFEAQRDREELLQNRGHEYVRAITLFVHKFNRFPATMDELENTNRMRFLRRRYVDPMTGKADWRILHAGPGGVITDSINNKAQLRRATGISSSPRASPDCDDDVPLRAETQMAAVRKASTLASRRRASDQPGAPSGDAWYGAAGTGLSTILTPR